MIFPSLRKTKHPYSRTHSNRNNWARLLQSTHSKRNCRTSCVWMNVSSHSSERKPSERANKQPPFDVYDSENAAFQNQQPNNNVEWTVLISAACSVMCWHLFSFIPNITFPFGSQCFFYVCVCVCWCSMTMRHLASKIHSRILTLLCSRKRDKKAKKSGPIKNRSLKCCELCFFFSLC